MSRSGSRPNRGHDAARWLRHRWPVVAATVFAALPIVVSGIRALASGWMPEGDDAIVSLRAHDVLAGHPPLNGVASSLSSFAANARLVTPTHPGPLPFYVLAPFVRLADGHAWGTVVGVLVINVVCLVGISVVCVRRRSPLLAEMAMVLVAALAWRLGDDIWHRPLNIYLSLLPYLFALFLAWAYLAGDDVLLPIAAFVASISIQAHLAFAAVLGPILVVMVGVTVYRVVRAPAADRLARGRPLALALVVGLVCWWPALWQQVSRPDGNVSAIVHSLTTPGGPRGIGTVAGLRVMAAATGLPPLLGLWPHQPQPATLQLHQGLDALTLFAVAVPLLGLGGVTMLALRRRRHDLVALGGTALLSLLLGCLVASRATSDNPTNFTWAWATGVFIWSALAWMAVRLGRPLRHRRQFPRELGYGLVALAALVTVVAIAEPRSTISTTNRVAVSDVRKGAGQLQQHLKAGERVWLTPMGSNPYLSTVPGIAAALVGTGHPVVVSGFNNVTSYGSFRDSSQHPVGRRVWVVAADQDHGPPAKGAALVYATAVDQREYRQARDQLIRLLRDAPPHITASGRAAGSQWVAEATQTQAQSQGGPAPAPPDQATVNRILDALAKSPETLTTAVDLADLRDRGFVGGLQLHGFDLDRYERLRAAATGGVRIWVAAPERPAG